MKNRTIIFTMKAGTPWKPDHAGHFDTIHTALVEPNGDVRVLDTVAGHFTNLHSLTEAQCECIRGADYRAMGI